jgi:hypothetical protein
MEIEVWATMEQDINFVIEVPDRIKGQEDHEYHRDVTSAALRAASDHSSDAVQGTKVISVSWSGESNGHKVFGGRS